jgi:hypothetical protein
MWITEMFIPNKKELRISARNSLIYLAITKEI